MIITKDLNQITIKGYGKVAVTVWVGISLIQLFISIILMIKDPVGMQTTKGIICVGCLSMFGFGALTLILLSHFKFRITCKEQHLEIQSMFNKFECSGELVEIDHGRNRINSYLRIKALGKKVLFLYTNDEVRDEFLNAFTTAYPNCKVAKFK